MFNQNKTESITSPTFFTVIFSIFFLLFSFTLYLESAEASHNYYIPYFSSGSNSWTGLGLTNCNPDTTAQIKVEVYLNNGYILTEKNLTLAANGQDSFIVADKMIGLGWIKIDSNCALSGLAFLGLNESCNLMADIPFVKELNTSLIIPHIAQNTTWNTSVLICNPQNKTVIVNLRYVDINGFSQGEKQYTMPAHGSNAFGLDTTFPEHPTITGKLYIEASEEITAFALYSNIKNNGTYYSGISAAPYNQPLGFMDATPDISETEDTELQTTPIFAIPDTGQIKCYSNDGCPVPGEAFYGQDAQYMGPRSYTKLDSNGNSLPINSSSWAMVRDNVTGLIWEAKGNRDDVNNYDNPHDADNEYTWYDTNPDTNGGFEGTAGNNTDTDDFLKALNTTHYGGYSDWRLPTPLELSYLAHSDKNNPAIDTAYFPQTALFSLTTQSCSSNYWTSTTYCKFPREAWRVDFSDGNIVMGAQKSRAYHVRAVHGQQQPPSPRSYTINGDGTITDNHTSLMWQLEPTEEVVTWERALQLCENSTHAGYRDWRLPNRNELSSLLDHTVTLPAITRSFISTTGEKFWTSTSSFNLQNNAWHVDFARGSVSFNSKDDYHYARAVRSLEPSNPGTGMTISPIIVSYSSGPAPLSVNFYCIASDPQGGTITAYYWDFDNDKRIDLTTATGNANHIFTTVGTHYVSCSATSISGKTVTSEPIQITVTGTPVYIPGSYNYFLPCFSTENGNWTGLALANSNPSKSSLAKVIVYNDNGNVIDENQLNLPADGQTAYQVTSAIPDKGWVHINSYQPLNGLAFLGSNNVVPLMADIPFVENPTNALVIPHIAQDNIWDTSILICNPQNTQTIVTINNIDKNGTVKESQNITIAAHGSGSYLLSSLFNNSVTLSGKVEIEALSPIVAFALYSNCKSGGSYYAGINAVPK